MPVTVTLILSSSGACQSAQPYPLPFLYEFAAATVQAWETVATAQGFSSYKLLPGDIKIASGDIYFSCSSQGRRKLAAAGRKLAAQQKQPGVEPRRNGASGMMNGEDAVAARILPQQQRQQRALQSTFSTDSAGVTYGYGAAFTWAHISADISLPENFNNFFSVADQLSNAFATTYINSNLASYYGVIGAQVSFDYPYDSSSGSGGSSYSSYGYYGSSSSLTETGMSPAAKKLYIGIGAGVGSIIIIAVIVGLVFWMRRRRAAGTAAGSASGIGKLPWLAKSSSSVSPVAALNIDMRPNMPKWGSGINP